MNGEAVDDVLIREEARALRPGYYELMGGGDPIALEMQLREWSRENVIERVLLRQEALKDDSTIFVNEQGIVQNEAALRVEKLIERVTAKVAPPKYKEVGEYYRKNKELLWVPDMVNAAHIIKNVDEANGDESAQAGIKSAQQELEKGANFAEVADRFSDCPGQGGDLGWFPRGKMVPEFDEVVFALQPGQISPIFRTQFGFHIARVAGKRSAGIPGLMDIRPHLEEMILREKRQRVLEEYVDRLKAKSEISG